MGNRRTCPSNMLHQKKLDMREKVLRIRRMQMLIINNRIPGGPISISGVIEVVEAVVDTTMAVEAVVEDGLTMMTTTHTMINLVIITPGIILIIGEGVVGVAVVVGIIATMLQVIKLEMSPPFHDCLGEAAYAIPFLLEADNAISPLT